MTKEIRVYVINCAMSAIDQRSEDEVFISEAEKLGTVYSLQRFEDDINDEILDLCNSFIRIREV